MGFNQKANAFYSYRFNYEACKGKWKTADCPPLFEKGRLYLSLKSLFLRPLTDSAEEPLLGVKLNPASPGLAYKLIGRGRRLTLKKRTFSSYKYVDPVENYAADVTSAWWETPQLKQESEWYLPKAKTEQTQFELPAPIPKPTQPIKKRQPYYPTSLEDEDDERAALRVYQTVERLSGAKTLSLSNARCLVDLYGREIVTSTVKRMEALHHKGKITQNAGFLITAARVSWRTTNHVKAFANAPRLNGEQRNLV